MSTNDLISGSIHWTNINHTTLGEMTGNDLAREYDIWAESYDKDLLLAKYAGPKIGATQLAELVTDKNARILDCACGTGMVGRELHQLGFTNLIGVDISQKSLEIASRGGHYRSLHTADVMTAELPFENDSFDAIACVGTFIPGHVNQSVFPKFIRVVKPGGVIVIAMRESYLGIGADYKGGKLDAAVVQQVEAGRWNYLYRQRVPGFIEGHAGVVFALEVLS